jgi:hypothetical protein
LDDDGCGALLLLAIIIGLLFYFTGKDVEKVAGEKVGNFYVENYPWPHSEVDAVKKCIYAIQSRNWENYQGCFEPSTILNEIEPGLPGEFQLVDYILYDSDGKVGIVLVDGFWYPSRLSESEETVYFREEIVVVKARKGLLGNIDLNIDVANEGWFVAYTEKVKLPFDFSSLLPSNQLTPTPTVTITPTITLTPVPFLNSTPTNPDELIITTSPSLIDQP